jgi:hypothetical protein
VNLVFADTVSAQAEQWYRDALASSTIDYDAAIPGTVTVTVVAEPSAPGHHDFMATFGVGDGWRTEIRRGADDPASPLLANIPGPARLFFMECVAHELAHILIFENVTDDDTRAAISALFRRTAPTGSVGTAGQLADWSAGAWEDRIVEAVAETIKDAALPDRRVYDNRTNWRLAEGDYLTLMTAVLGSGSGFSEDFATDPTGAWTQLGGAGVVRAGAIYGSFIYVVPFAMPAAARMGYKVVAPNPDEPAVLAMVDDADLMSGRGVAMIVGPTDVVLNIAGPTEVTNDSAAHGIDFAAGGTWWFTLEFSAGVATATISSSPSGTPDFSHTFSGQASTSVLAPLFGGAGTDDNTHYDDWFAGPLTVEPPDWPYIAPSVNAVAGAPAAVRLTR